jgi:group I intron endonuclease
MNLNVNDKNKCGIYIITNNINNKVYIGKSKNIYLRIKNHITNLNRKIKNQENFHLISSWHKYGKNNFNYNVLEYLELNEDLLKEKELFYIMKYESTNPNKGYNIRLDTSTGLIVSNETKQKLSKSGKESYLKNPNRKEKVSTFFKDFWKNNPETLENMKKKLSKIKIKYKIGKFSKDLELLEVFESKQQLLDIYPDYYIQAIYGCCQGQKKSYKSFKWFYLDDKNSIVLKNTTMI